MSVISARDVEESGGELLLGPRDLVTPLARERAKELGVALRVEGEPRPDLAPAARRETVPTQPADPAGQLNALFRRGAPLPQGFLPAASPDRSGADRPGQARRRPRAAVIGAGHVGSITTLRLAEADVLDEVVLVDVVDGLAAGVALDLWHSADLGGFATQIRGTSDLGDVAGCDYVVITAGRARTPGMTRTDLTQANAEIVGPVAEAIAKVAPYAVIVVVTNPLEEMTHLAQLRSGFPSSRVLGMAGVLDTARFKALVGLTGVGRPDQVQAIALGSHGPEMVIPLSQASVAGRPLAALLDPATLSAITDRTRDSGAEVVALLKTGSAYFAPGQSAARMVTAMVTGSGEVMSCAVVPDGEYGLRETRVGLPARLGREGLESIVMLDLTAAEQEALRIAAASLAERIREIH